MSLWMYARMNRNNLDSKLVEKMLKDFFPDTREFVRNIDETAVRTVIRYQGVSSKLEKVLFVTELKQSYNAYESNLNSEDFQYEQELIFCLDKTKVSVDVIRMVVDFCIYLRRHIECDILVTSDMHDEICLLKNQTIIWNEDVMHLSPWKSVFSIYLNHL